MHIRYYGFISNIQERSLTIYLSGHNSSLHDTQKSQESQSSQFQSFSAPMISVTELHPWTSSHSPIPSRTFMVTAGSMKLAVPISTAVAPAIKNSMASDAVEIPPRPITGIFTARATCHTILIDMGNHDNTPQLAF